MNDKELLEMAAKAASLENAEYAESVGGQWNIYHGEEGNKSTWNPLDDDGDALRLAVSLSLLIRHSANRMEAYLMGYPRTKASILFSYDPDQKPYDQADKQSATRMAIVTAAAKIGGHLQ